MTWWRKRGDTWPRRSGILPISAGWMSTDGASVMTAVRSTVDRFGAIHVAVNCAGVATPGKVLGKEGPMDIQPFNRVVQINLVGTMNVIRFAAEQMAKNQPNEDGERGVLINTASIAGFEGQIGQAAYASSKAGVIGMTLPDSPRACPAWRQGRHHRPGDVSRRR